MKTCQLPFTSESDLNRLKSQNNQADTLSSQQALTENIIEPPKGRRFQESAEASSQLQSLESPLLEKAAPPAKAKGKPKPESEAAQALNRQIWDEYAAAYHDRYQAEPVRNAKVNGQINLLAQRLGKNAPQVAAFFVSLNDQWYTRNFHSLGLLLSNCEGIHTAWKTGQNLTSVQARHIENTQTNINAANYADDVLSGKRHDPVLAFMYPEKFANNAPLIIEGEAQ